MTKVLFVCTGNVDRSPTAQALFTGSTTVDAQSAGTAPTAVTSLSKALVDWADLIFVMEPKHQRAVLTLNPHARQKVICLNIPDIYARGDPELKQLLTQKLKPYLP
jgi:predicted protein tyrosine phosphatase